MKRKLVVANWKMHLNTHESSLLVKRLHDHIQPHRTVEVVLAPSLLVLQPLSREIDRRVFRLAAQNAYAKDEGAFTGEVSFTMLRDLVHYAIVGHSERRLYFNETLEIVRDKVQASVRNGITPILCVGETHQERVDHETNKVIHDQVSTAISNLTSDEIENVVITYEPPSAISTFGGELPKPSQIEEGIKKIRHTVSELYGPAAAENLRVLYGGSVTADTAPGYLAVEGCDGALVGSASLNYKQFSSIIDAAYRTTHGEEPHHG